MKGLWFSCLGCGIAVDGFGFCASCAPLVGWASPKRSASHRTPPAILDRPMSGAEFIVLNRQNHPDMPDWMKE